MSTSAELTVAEFNRVAAGCRRWSKRSLDVARALLVEDQRPVDVANSFDMTAQQAVVIRARFRDRVRLAGVKKVSATSFMAAEKPQSEAVLLPFKPDLQKLKRANYSPEQMLEFLERNEIKTDLATLVNFMEGIGDANSRSRK